MIGAKMIATKQWSATGVKNMEEFDAKPFIEEMNKHGLPIKIIEVK
jgi:saccharopine dehydrogenase (NAD+, L-lysine-forming)